MNARSLKNDIQILETHIGVQKRRKADIQKDVQDRIDEIDLQIKSDQDKVKLYQKKLKQSEKAE